MALLKHAKSKEDIRSISKLFCAINATVEEISTADQKLFVLMYGGKDENLNELKYHRYMSAVASSNLGVRPEKLPATECAAKYHAQRVHLQVLQWTHLATVITPENWGWKVEGGKYLPIMMDKKPATPELLNVKRCKCKKGCSAACSCKRNRLKCVSACAVCKGLCKNSEPISRESEESENDVTSTEMYKNIFGIFNI